MNELSVLTSIPVDLQKKQFRKITNVLKSNGVKIQESHNYADKFGFGKIVFIDSKDRKKARKHLDDLLEDSTYFIEKIDWPDNNRNYVELRLSLHKFNNIRTSLTNQPTDVGALKSSGSDQKVLESTESILNDQRNTALVIPDDYTYEEEFIAFKSLLRELGFTSKHISNFAPAARNGSLGKKRLSCRSVLAADLLFDVLVNFPNFFGVDLPKANGNVKATGVIIYLKFGCFFSGSVDHATFFDEKILDQFKKVGIDITKIKKSKKAYTMRIPKVTQQSIQTDVPVNKPQEILVKKVESVVEGNSVLVAAELAIIRGAYNMLSTDAKHAFLNEIIGRSDKFVKIEELKDLGWIKADESGLVRPEDHIMELAAAGFKSKDAFEKDLKDALLKNKEALLKEIKDKGLVIVNPDDLFDKSVKGFSLKEVKL